jgi:phosphopantothenoylcysteine decarboxylase/phosphopantothenate--cysteine ligase
MERIKNKNIIVGISGGIAAYKAAEMVRHLVREGARVKVVMTSNATRFITPLTLEALTGNRVITDMFDVGTEAMDHISWGQSTDLIIIAPATANIIGKMANGICDDFLTTMVLAATAKILVCPAMNTQMFMNEAVQGNIKRLENRDYTIMPPSLGELACGTEGPGRLPEPECILEKVLHLITERDLADMRVVVTAGPTMEPLDPVRYLTNRSSGKMGYALARAAAYRGARVTLVSGPSHLAPPSAATFIAVKTTQEMRRAVLSLQENCDVIIKAAAVLDYRPRVTMDQKMKKKKGGLNLELVRTPDILAELGSAKGQGAIFLVGFAAETEDLLSNAKGKLENKNLDMIVANDVSAGDSGFDADTNKVQVIYRNGKVEDLPLMSKEVLADQLLDRIKRQWTQVA